MRTRLATVLEGLALVLACLTLTWGPLAQGSTFGWGLSGLSALGSLTFAVTLLALGVRGQVRVSNPWWLAAALAFLAWVWASTTWAPYGWEAYRWAGVWTAVIGTAISLHLLATTRARQAVVLTVMVLTGAAALALAYLQTRGVFVPGFEYYPGAGPQLVTGPYFNPSHFSGFLIPVAALLTGLILFTRPHLHTLVLAGLLAALHWLNLQTDASSIPAVLLATGLPFLVWVWTKSKWVGAAFSALVLGNVVVGLLFFVTPQGQATFAEYKGHLGLNNSWTSFINLRRAVWHYGQEMWSDHLIVGSGVGQFISEAPRYRVKERETRTSMDRKSVNYAHNDALQTGSELGLIGLVLLTFVILLPLASKTSIFGMNLWVGLLPVLLFVGVYESHLTAIAGSMLFIFVLSVLELKMD